MMADCILSRQQLPREKIGCPACDNDEAVFFQSQQRSAETGMVSPMPFFFGALSCS